MRLANNLELERCPHCNVDRPFLEHRGDFQTADHKGEQARNWKIYCCRRCGNLVMAFVWQGKGDDVVEYFPDNSMRGVLHDAIPSRAREFLKQAIDSRHAPAGAVMLAASAVDAMLKAKNYRDRSLYSRIDQAAVDHVITAEMAQWAHAVRLDANDQRHADENAELPSEVDAQRSIEFASALAQFLFVLPARVAAGIGAARSQVAG